MPSLPCWRRLAGLRFCADRGFPLETEKISALWPQSKRSQPLVDMLLRGGVLGAKRIARHLWRMCFGLFIAAGSFFLGPSNRPLRLLSTVGIGQHLSPALFSTTLYLILTVLPLIMLIFWLVRLRFANAYEGSIQPASASPDLTR
jgi:hypothetical protein